MVYLEIDKEVYYKDIYKAAKKKDRVTFRELFFRLHDRDQYDVFVSLYPENKLNVVDLLEPAEFAELFEWMEIDEKDELVQTLPADYLAEMFNNLPNDDVVYFITQSNEVDKDQLLDLMDDQESERVLELLSYAQDSAGSIMTKEFIGVDYQATLGNTINMLREIGHQAETIYYLYVLDEDKKLVGVLSLRDLLLSPETDLVEDTMYTQVVTARVDQDQEEVAAIIRDYDLLAIPVLSHDGRMQGIVTVDDIMDVIEDEANEDFIEFAGIRPTDSENRVAGIFTAVKERLPWILVLLVLSLLTGGLISAFEHTLAENVMLATFIPMIMATAGNIGTQTLAVSVRNIARDVSGGSNFAETVKEEIGIGALIGVFISIALVILVAIMYQNIVLALVLSATMLLTAVLSTFVGTLIPKIIQMLKIDPAAASGPFITTINDALALLIYFTIATMFISYL